MQYTVYPCLVSSLQSLYIIYPLSNLLVYNKDTTGMDIIVIHYFDMLLVDVVKFCCEVKIKLQPDNTKYMYIHINNYYNSPSNNIIQCLYAIILLSCKESAH